jgi:hypothetical protein
MNLQQYFEETKGFCVLATANDEGKVDAAVYARPHVLDDGTLVSIMRDRLTHENLKTNPHAVFLFMEEGHGYKGKRIFETKTQEERNSDLADEICRRCYPRELNSEEKPRFVVYFKVDRVIPLIGAGDENA